MKSYLKLCSKFETINRLQDASSILSWDNSVMMPSGSATDRAKQQATIAGICHQIITSSEVEDLLDDAEQNEIKDLDDWQKSNLKLMRNQWIHNNAISEDLLKAFSMAGAECEMRWRTAKTDNDFNTFSFFMKPVLKLAREIAGLKSEALKLSKYNSLLDYYDEGRSTDEIEIIFNDLKSFLPNFIEKVKEKQSKTKILKPSKDYPIQEQKNLAIEMMNLIGFDFNKGRLDVSAHPFSGGTSDDVRITTRYNKDDFTKSLMGVFHETGHAMYSFGLPEKFRCQPVGNSLGMTIHESQSLLLEMQVCRSKEFIGFLTGYIKKYFGDYEEHSFENLYNYYNHVNPSFIRVDADEVTYPLHVILRYEIEKMLIEGSLEIDSLPDVWNSKMQNYLGIKPKNHAEGCMQDIHWTDGSFGYFPTYTLGAIAASQFFNQANLDVPNLKNDIAKGKFYSLISWLKENVHSFGALYNANQLIEKVTHRPLDSNIFKQYLKNKYLD